MHIAVIPARSGSQGVPNKNLLTLWGTSLIGWAALTAKATGLFDAIILSTDSEIYAVEGKNYGCIIPFLRPDHLASNEANINRVLLHLLEEAPGAKQWQTITLLEPTSPLRTPEIVKRCHDLLTENLDSINTAVTISMLPYTYHAVKQLSMDEKGAVSFSHALGATVNNRQSLQPAYVRNGMAYVFQCESFRNTGNLMHGSIRGVVTDEPQLNIDHPKDVDILRQFESSHAIPEWYSKLLKQNLETSPHGFVSAL